MFSVPDALSIALRERGCNSWRKELKTNMSNESFPRVKSADRALAIVEFLSQRGSAGFMEVTTALELPRSSTHTLLRTLVSSGWVSLDDSTRQYSLGLRAWQVGQAYRGNREMSEIASPLMDDLAARLGETVQLAQLDGFENVYVAISESPHPMRLVSSVGMRLPAHATGIGKSLFSLLDDDVLRERIAQASPLEAFTERTVTTERALLERVDACRDDGYTIDDEEYVHGCRCVAVPVYGDRGRDLYFALSVTMPTVRTGSDWVEDTLPALRECAGEIRRLYAGRARAMSGR